MTALIMISALSRWRHAMVLAVERWVVRGAYQAEVAAMTRAFVSRQYDRYARLRAAHWRRWEATE